VPKNYWWTVDKVITIINKTASFFVVHSLHTHGMALQLYVYQSGLPVGLSIMLPSMSQNRPITPNVCNHDRYRPI